MPNYIEKVEKYTLPVIPVKSIFAFPGITLNFELTDKMAVVAAKSATKATSLALVVAYTETLGDKLDTTDLFKVGTVVKIKQSIQSPEGNMRIIVEGISRAVVDNYTKSGSYYTADITSKTMNLTDNGGLKGEAYIRDAINGITEIIKFLPKLNDNITLTLSNIKDPGAFADFAASYILVKPEDKQQILECFEPIKRIEKLIMLLNSEIELLDCELDIHNKVRAKINRQQKEMYLREQLNVIKSELGDNDSQYDNDNYLQKIMQTKLPKEVREKLISEAEKLTKMPFGSGESGVMRSYLDTCLEIPWEVRTKDRIDIAAASKILDADHDGLEDVKNRILEYLAVKQFNPDIKNQILCFVGPPGVGKTSIAASIARAMKRKYVRISLGGVRDEADIRGHRKTYIGAMPGRIINALIKVKVKNPLILLDEIDKLTKDAHGDPASALLEVLDSEQNHAFRDHFVELDTDLSECLFIATANTLETVPRPLIDRMEIIELHTYTRNEKLAIAKNHLVPKQLKRHGLTKRNVKITDEAVSELIDYYTREAGVRNLEREIANLCRKSAKYLIETKEPKIIFNSSNITTFLGGRKYLPEMIETNDEIGVANGLAYTEVGGEMLKIEVAVLDGTGKLELTGSLGDVMKESAHAALTYVRSIAKELGIDPDFYKNRDIHIHVPDGAVPKDGPSAGITMMSAIVSALTGRPFKHALAMTGEITIRGRVLPIGGLREKTMAAYTAGIKKIIIPDDNVKDLEKLDKLVLENITFIPCKHASEVLKEALLPNEIIYTDIHTANLDNNILQNIVYATPNTNSKGETYGI